MADQLQKKTETDMSFWDHLNVMRSALFRSAIVVVLFTIVAFFFKGFLMDTVIFGPKEPEFITNRLFCQLGQLVVGSDVLCINQVPIKMVITDIPEKFRLHLVITFVAGIILSMPYLLFEFWKFLKPALTDKEKKGSSGFVLITNFLFLTGVAFGYFLIIPLAFNFLTTYNLSSELQDLFKVGSYIKLVVSVSLSTGLVFELPVIIFFLTKVGIVDTAILKKYRRHAIVVFFVLASIITPPDVFSQFLVAVPMMGLYEISIVVAKRIEKKEIPEL